MTTFTTESRRRTGFIAGLVVLLGASMLFSSVMVSTAHAKESLKRVSVKGITVTVPSSWQLLSVDDPKLTEALKAASKANPQFGNLTPATMKQAGIAFFATAQPTANFANNVNGQVITGAPQSLDGAKPDLRAALEGQGATITTQSDLKVSGRAAVRTDYTLGVNALNGKKLTVYGTQVVTLKGGKAYIVTISLGTNDKTLRTSLVNSIQVA